MIFQPFLGKGGKKKILKILFILSEKVIYIIIIEERKGEFSRRINGAVLSENLVFRRTPEKNQNSLGFSFFLLPLPSELPGGTVEWRKRFLPTRLKG